MVLLVRHISRSFCPHSISQCVISPVQQALPSKGFVEISNALWSGCHESLSGSAAEGGGTKPDCLSLINPGITHIRGNLRHWVLGLRKLLSVE